MLEVDPISREATRIERAMMGAKQMMRSDMAAAGDTYLSALRDAKARLKTINERHLNEPYYQGDTVTEEDLHDRVSSLIGKLHAEITETKEEQQATSGQLLTISNNTWTEDFFYTLEVTGEITSVPNNGSASGGVLDGKVNGLLNNEIRYTGDVVAFSSSSGPGPSNITLAGAGAGTIYHDGTSWQPTKSSGGSSGGGGGGDYEYDYSGDYEIDYTLQGASEGVGMGATISKNDTLFSELDALAEDIRQAKKNYSPPDEKNGGDVPAKKEGESGAMSIAGIGNLRTIAQVVGVTAVVGLGAYSLTQSGAVEMDDVTGG